MFLSKKRLKVALVAPPPRRVVERHDMRPFPHVGLGYIAAYLKGQGVEIHVVDAKFERLSLEETVTRLCSLAPNILGVTSMTHEILQANAVALAVKKCLPEIVAVLGGPHATALPIQTLMEYPVFNALVFGEGEYSFSELINAIEKGASLDGIKGVAFHTGEGVRQNAARSPIMNLDELPPPAWELFPQSQVLPVITARGCPFRCNFCMRVMGSRVRKRSPDKVIAELANSSQNGKVKRIIFLDETLNVDRQHLRQLLDRMVASGLHKQFEWEASLRADLADYPLLKTMKDAGCTWVGFGIESGNDEILKRTGKGITREQVRAAIRASKRAGLKTDAYFIIGHPLETPRAVRDTIDFATELNTTRLTLGTMVPYPGTEIYDMAKRGEGGYRLLSTHWEDFNKNIGNSIELVTLSREQMERLQVWGYLTFYLRNVRFVDGLRYLLFHRRLALAIIKKMFSSAKRSREAVKSEEGSG